MRVLRVILLRLRSLVWSRRVESELDAELRFHVERQVEVHIAAGLSAEAARTQALHDVGAIERWKEECRDRWGWRDIHAFSRDIRHTYCAVRARPGASAAIVLVLGLGLGLAATMFALADPFALRPLPYRDSAELVVLGLGSGVRTAITKDTELPTVERWRDRTDLFQHLTTIDQRDLRLQLADGAVALRLLDVGPDALDLLGLDNVGFRDWPTASAGEMMIALTAEGRASLAGAEPGQVFSRQDGGVVRIGAILPPTFRFPLVSRVDGLAPHNPAPPILQPTNWGAAGQLRGFSTHTVLARLQPSVNTETVRHALALRPPIGEPVLVDVTSLEERLTGSLRRLAWGALAAGLLVLVLCVANVANLLLARSISRAPEFATRLAVGASHRDLARLVMVELTALVTVAIVSALTLVHILLSTARFIIPDEYTGFGMPAITLRVAGFTILAGVVIVVVSTIPWLTIRRLATRTADVLVPRIEGRSTRLLRFVMTTGQSIVAMILVAGAALLGRSFANLSGQDTGFAADPKVVAVSYPPALAGSALEQVIDGTVARLQRIPGVTRVGAATGSMVDGVASGTVYTVRGKPALADVKQVTHGYFDSVGTHVIAGRGLDEADRRADVIVVNEAMASRFWPTDGAVGQPVTDGQRSLTVIGVVRDSRDKALDRPPTPTVFSLFDNPRSSYRVNYVVQSEVDPESLLQRAITEVERTAVILDVSSLEERLLDSVDTRVFATLVIGLFAVASLSVCAAGLGGIVSFLVARRTREIAIRTAVGAEPGHLRWLVMRQALTASALGLVLGAVAGRWLSRSLESLLYGVEAGDWLTLAAGGAFLLIVVVAATWLPATRALRISPTMALKVE
jgi:predicted permease